jgi:hypothetical protein
LNLASDVCKLKCYKSFKLNFWISFLWTSISIVTPTAIVLRGVSMSSEGEKESSDGKKNEKPSKQQLDK